METDKELFTESEKEILERKYRRDEVRESDLSFGRIMPFGKYKGKYIYHLLVKHHRYMDWIVNNTQFKLTETEMWWKKKIDDFVSSMEDQRTIQILSCLVGYLPTGDNPYENNPHAIVE